MMTDILTSDTRLRNRDLCRLIGHFQHFLSIDTIAIIINNPDIPKYLYFFVDLLND